MHIALYVFPQLVVTQAEVYQLGVINVTHTTVGGGHTTLLHFVRQICKFNGRTVSLDS